LKNNSEESIKDVYQMLTYDVKEEMLGSRICEDLVWNNLVSSNVSPIVWNFLNNILANKDN